jgi:Transposase DDE domain group 1
VPTECNPSLFEFARGIALGYEDLIDHDELRHDPVLAILAGKLAARRSNCAPLAGKSTLNRLELSRTEPTRYNKLSADTAAIEGLFIDLFLGAHRRAPEQITLDLDATDDPLHGHQEGRFFHGYYDCYCYLPLYVFCGRHLLAAKLRRSNIDASAGAVDEIGRIVRRIRARWPRVRILVRADSGFAREPLMAWCEDNRVDYLFGLAGNERLTTEIATEIEAARIEAEASGKPARRFRDFTWSTLDSWSRIWQGRVDRRCGQPTLCRHFAQARAGRGTASLRNDLLRARRDGEPDQGMPARFVRRPHLRDNHAGQPDAPVVRLLRVCPALRAASDRAYAYPVRQCDMRLDPAEAPQNRRARPRQRPPDQRRHWLPPARGNMSSPSLTPCCNNPRGSNTHQIAQAAISPTTSSWKGAGQPWPIGSSPLLPNCQYAHPANKKPRSVRSLDNREKCRLGCRQALSVKCRIAGVTESCQSRGQMLAARHKMKHGRGQSIRSFTVGLARRIISPGRAVACQTGTQNIGQPNLKPGRRCCRSWNGMA